ncbi:MAG: RdgB/HAM1 family non-canonical purine NTP pyrophosphatase [Prevotellaceae bacterium]|jgi:XTP/dITP diphosphohydrolase|nr:RdgB/HAM1 family non-canonical purine NTP pyrophosphatase [Prevotellaceae bacterium]
MKNLIFATNNEYKVSEATGILGRKFKVLSLADMNFSEELLEDAETLEGNALLKAAYIYDQFGLDCFADDTGLEVDALNGAPGVYSARYAGKSCDAEKNMQKLLNEMQKQTNRKACFRTVIVLIKNGKTHHFEGKIDGEIGTKPSGNQGFGYDPVFIPNGFNKSFAGLSPHQKNRISHRAIALKKMAGFLR